MFAPAFNKRCVSFCFAARVTPAIGKGNDAHAHPTDLKGAPRNARTGVDIGAYQH